MSFWRELEARYGIQIVKKYKIRDVYHLKTMSHGHLCLKFYEIPEDELRFISQVFLQLSAAGFEKSPTLLSTLDQAFWIARGSAYGMITNWAVGRQPDLTSRSDFKKTVRTLAKFHRVSIGFPEGEVPEARVRYSKMGEQIAEYKEVLLPYKGLERLTSICDIVLSDLQQPGIVKGIEKEQSLRTFVHGDYNYPNLVKNSAGKIQMIDFENTSLHIRVQDLAHLLHRNFPWQGETMIRWVEYYDSKRTLSKGEKLLLRLLLLVPYPVVRSLRRNKHLNRLDPPLPSAEQFRQYVHDLKDLL
ncbi:aminoglycoside phosphotransferase family protein [Paenibacillus sp. RC67]|uniref:aminoglycoside phosphotransferase family protein n=1 Tax=Paenibacillus sp. RC67 TaxID=3039392 RepID=UPI0024AD7C8D|nr:aminoglycoside phosphotransferase family protein [Paenibacillus sp. RC67]